MKRELIGYLAKDTIDNELNEVGLFIRKPQKELIAYGTVECTEDDFYYIDHKDENCNYGLRLKVPKFEDGKLQKVKITIEEMK